MAIGDKARKALAERQAAMVQAEATEVSPDDLNAQDEAAEAAREAHQAAPVGAAGGLNLTFAQLKELMALNQSAGISPEQIADIAANAAAKAKLPENKRPPLVSVYNPAGERDHPRPKLKCHVYMGSAPVGSPKEAATLTTAEIEALNGLRPGFFKVRKLDGSDAVVEVKAQMNSNLQIERLWILLPAGDDQKNLYPPMVDFATQIAQESNRVEPMVA